MFKDRSRICRNFITITRKPKSKSSLLTIYWLRLTLYWFPSLQIDLIWKGNDWKHENYRLKIHPGESLSGRIPGLKRYLNQIIRQFCLVGSNMFNKYFFHQFGRNTYITHLEVLFKLLLKYITGYHTTVNSIITTDSLEKIYLKHS